MEMERWTKREREREREREMTDLGDVWDVNQNDQVGDMLEEGGKEDPSASILSSWLGGERKESYLGR